MAGKRDIVHLGQPSVIPAFEATMTGILQDLPPDALGFPRDDRVHTRHGLVRTHGGMDATHDHGHAQTPEVSGHFISAVRLRGESGNACQVRSRHARVVRHAQILIPDRHLPLRWGQTGQDHQTERLPDAVMVPAVLLDFARGNEWVSGVYQMEAH